MSKVSFHVPSMSSFCSSVSPPSELFHVAGKLSLQLSSYPWLIKTILASLRAQSVLCIQTTSAWRKLESTLQLVLICWPKKFGFLLGCVFYRVCPATIILSIMTVSDKILHVYLLLCRVMIEPGVPKRGFILNILDHFVLSETIPIHDPNSRAITYIVLPRYQIWALYNFVDIICPALVVNLHPLLIGPIRNTSISDFKLWFVKRCDWFVRFLWLLLSDLAFITFSCFILMKLKFGGKTKIFSYPEYKLDKSSLASFSVAIQRQWPMPAGGLILIEIGLNRYKNIYFDSFLNIC